MVMPTLHNRHKGVTGFDGDQEVNGACRALGVSLNLREMFNCQRRIGPRSLINCDVSLFFVCGHGRGATAAGWSNAGAQRQWTRFSGLANALSRSVGVDGRES